MRKTLKLIENYKRILLEQGEEGMSPEEMQGMQGMEGQEGMEGQDVTEMPEEPMQEEMPFTSESENQYIEDLIDAALYEPSSEDAKTLTDLQGIVKMKKFTNAREEILPTLLKIIRPSTEDNDIRGELNNI